MFKKSAGKFQLKKHLKSSIQKIHKIQRTFLNPLKISSSKNPLKFLIQKIVAKKPTKNSSINSIQKIYNTKSPTCNITLACILGFTSTHSRSFISLKYFNDCSNFGKHCSDHSSTRIWQSCLTEAGIANTASNRRRSNSGFGWNGPCKWRS
jgi:hypothetical protein